jgi:RNA polymerase sigma factor (sigma-70 family)
VGDGLRSTEEFEAVVRAYGRLVQSVVERVGGAASRAEREDIAQRVVVALWEHLRRGETIHAPEAYLYRCAVRETIRHLRRAVRTTSLPADAEGVTVLVSGAPSPERALDSARAAEKVESALSALPREREQAVRAHLAGFTVAELMALHDWPYHKARNLIARGLADLRELLRAAGIDRA